MKVTPTDGELLMRFDRNRDDAAFEELVKRHQASVYGVCIRTLGNRHDAEDAFQATFLVLARKAGRLSGADSIGGWLFRVALRTARNARSRKNRSPTPMQLPEPVGARDPLDEIQEREMLAMLYDELSKLPEKYRTPLVLCVLEGRSRLEASHHLDCSVASLKARLERGKKRLRMQLTRRGAAFSMVLAVTFDKRIANQSLDALTSSTTAQCSSFVFGKEGAPAVPSELLKLSNSGISIMTLSTFSKLAITSLAITALGLGGLTTPETGTRNANAADVFALDATSQTPATASVTLSPSSSASNLNSKVTNTTINRFVESTPVKATHIRYTTNSGGKTLSDEASKEVIDALIEAMSDAEPEVQHQAVQTLSTMGKGIDEVIEAFNKVVEQSKDEKLRYYAIASLGRVGDGNEDAIATLIRLVKGNARVVLRKKAMGSLAKIGLGHDGAALALASCLRDEETEIRIAAAMYLQQIEKRTSPVLGRSNHISLPKQLQSPEVQGSTGVVSPASSSGLRSTSFRSVR